MTISLYKKLREELVADEPYRRYEAAILIGECEDMLGVSKNQELLEMLYPLLQDNNNHVRYYAVEAVGKFKDISSIPHLRDSINTLSQVRCPQGDGIQQEGLSKKIQESIDLIENA